MEAITVAVAEPSWLSSHAAQISTLEALWHARDFYGESGAAVLAATIDAVAARFAEAGHRLGDGRLLTRALLLRKSDLEAVLLARPAHPYRLDGEEHYPSIDANRTSFFGRYLHHVQDSEPHLAYHFWSVAAILGAFCRRNLWVERGTYRVYPALYVILVGPTGARKTTAINLAMDLFERGNEAILVREVAAHKAAPFNGPVHTKQVKRLPTQDTSSEFLGDALAGSEKYDDNLLRAGIASTVYDGSVGVIACDEVTRLIGRDVPGGRRIVNFLTDMFGCPDNRPAGTRKHGVRRLRDIALTALLGSTSDWIREEVTPSMLRGGFPGRCVYVPRWGMRQRVSWPFMLDPFAAHDLAAELANLAMMRPHPMRIADDAHRWFDEWYKAQPECTNPNLLSYHSRRHDHLLRLAMLLTVSEFGPFETLTIATLQRAEKILAVEEALAPAVFEEFDQHPNEHLYMHILDQMTKSPTKPWVPRWWLAQRTRGRTGTAKHFDELIETLIQGHTVERAVMGKGTVVYRVLKEVVAEKEPQPPGG